MKIEHNPAPLFLLGLLFVGLKLTNFIGWSWWWVTLPFWGALAVFVFGLLLYVLYRAARIFIIEPLLKRKR